jgi:F-type H+-transporting ATPase subunit delta
MAGDTVVATPYARAAYEYAKAHKKVAQWAAILLACGEVICNDDIALLLSHPMIGQVVVVEALIAVLGKKLDQHQSNFLRLLAEKRRLSVLAEIANLFVQEQQADEAVVHATIVTADKITKAVLKHITMAIEKQVAKEVALEHEVDESLIGGAIVRIGDRVIDASIKGQLKRLAQQMIH